MKLILLLFAIFIARTNSFKLPSCDPAVDTDCIDSKEEAVRYVNSLNATSVENEHQYFLAVWKYVTNITAENKKKFEDKRIARNNFRNEVTRQLKRYNWNSFNDKQLVRLATAYYLKGDDIPAEIFERQTNLLAKLEGDFGSAKVCSFEDSSDENCEKKLDLEKGLKNVFIKSRNHQELLYYWKEWRKVTGDRLRDDYIEFVKISNLSAIEKGFNDLKGRFLEPYGVDDLPSLMQSVYSDHHDIQGKSLSLEDLYTQLHTFVKGKLIQVYKGQVNINGDGYIPAHILGEMYAQNWVHLIEHVKPYPNAKAINITQALIDKKYTVQQIVSKADKFFESLGFEPLNQKFRDYSIFEKPNDGRKIDCQGSAFDMFDYDDYRIKHCAQVIGQDFRDIHILLGILYNNKEYRNNPFPYRSAANPGFTNAIGDLISLAARSPSNLIKLNLLESEDASQGDDVDLDGTTYKKSDINNLMSVALDQVAFLPYGLALEFWRLKFFSGQINDNNLNEEYWKLRKDLQGVEAPVIRTEANLDPLALHHVATQYPYIGFLFSGVIQYQFYEALCEKSGQYNPGSVDGRLLHQCDFSTGGHQTGRLLRNMMEKGSRVEWKVAMNEVTDDNGLSGKSMLKYFLPLYRFLEQENANNRAVQPFK